MNLEQYWNRFRAIEQETKAMDFKVLGFQIWPLLRTKIYYQIAQSIELFDNPHPKSETFEPKTLPKLTPAKTIVIPFQRKVRGVDSYSNSVVMHLDNPKILDFESSDGFDIATIKNSFAHYEPHVARAMRRLTPKNLPDRWSKIIAGLEKEFGVEIKSYREYPKWFIRRSIIEAMGFRKVFRELKTKKLYLVNAYSHPTVVLGAKVAGARVYEIQHGFISKFHPAYSYGNIKVQSMPHVFLSWGDYWNQNFDKPKNLKVITFGASTEFLNYLTQKPKTIPGRIVFTSQGAIGKKLFEVAKRVSKNTNHEVIFRLHPNEDPESFKTDLPNLVVSHKDPKFLDLVSTAEYLVGGFSTTMFEGLALGCKLIAVNVPGIENLGTLRDEIPMLNLDCSKAEIENALATAITHHNGDFYYASQRPEALRG